ncbi:MAG: hypothetical protein EHM24_29820 [Acidobacteria bacterium]|nr:MAG: hypothetical protein EHM24_29820 [Acidobacteriota bacterium]
MRLFPLVMMAALALVAPRESTAAPDLLQTTTKKPTTQKPPARKPAAKPAPRRPAAPPVPKLVAEAPAIQCPQVLGMGVGSKLRFCDVMTSLVPSEGILIRFSPHKGPLKLSFDLHNRHTYSEQETSAGRGYAQYTATIGVLTMDGKLLGRGVVQSEFRSARDLFDRISGGAGPRGVKAVAPTGIERIVMEVPEGVDEVSVLGEKLSVVTLAGANLFTAAQRPIAVVSNFSAEYTAAPAKTSPAATRKRVARAPTKR